VISKKSDARQQKNRFSAKQAITISIVLTALLLAVYASTQLSEQTALIALVESWGYPAVVVLGFISGINAIIPIPAATLTPVFSAAGLLLPGIILSLVAGTMIADLCGYLFGASTKNIISEKYPRLVNFLQHIVANHRRWLIPFVIVYAAFIPFPNEAILIPLAFSGITFRYLLIPLIIGNTLHQLVLVYGVIGLTRLFS